MTHTLVIGYGNPLRGDDRVGWAVVEALEAAQTTAVSIQTAHQLLPEFSESISVAECVIFVDAAVAAGAPGQVRLTAVTPAPPGPHAFTHHLTPSGLLAMARDVYGRCPPAHLITITGHDFGFSEQLSPAAAAAVPQALAHITRLHAACHSSPQS